jgi:hypothetical protein
MKKLPLSLVSLLSLVALAWSFPAHAQLDRGDFRFSLDTDVISVARVNIDPDGPAGDYDQTVFGLGPSQLGASHVTQPASPVGLGFGYVLHPKFVLGMRLGLGFDVVDRENASDARMLGVSLMPTLTIVPVGRTAKLFISVAPLLQVNRVKVDEYVNRWLQGGFSLGIGCLIFPVSAASADLGFHFEGRFGNNRVENDDDNGDTRADIADLRGVVRLGLSLWR